MLHNLTPELARTIVRDRARDAEKARRERRDSCGDVEAAAAGDSRAWEALVAEYGGLVRGIARSHGLSAADADDVAQETWMRVLRYIDRIAEPRAFAGWLATTTRREALRVLHHRTREVLLSAIAEADEPDAADPLRELIASERHEALHDAIGRLSDRQRSVVQAMVGTPFASYVEVADQLGAPIGSLGPTRGRALERLRRDTALSAVIR